MNLLQKLGNACLTTILFIIFIPFFDVFFDMISALAGGEQLVITAQSILSSAQEYMFTGIMFGFFIFFSPFKKHEIKKEERLNEEDCLNNLKSGRKAFYWGSKVLLYSGYCLLISSAILFVCFIVPFPNARYDAIGEMTKNSFYFGVIFLILGWFASQLSSIFQAINYLIEDSKGVI
ncbi:hypothetical protein MJH12_13140 [bacterium]|nr:hypothetical protein [bacterium]